MPLNNNLKEQLKISLKNKRDNSRTLIDFKIYKAIE